ncbi:Nudix hydrolase 26, chloroplastic [Triticum urartu]|uniref:Nudix hydrolase 26, chloroplastic n=1 Tax=Triticum urartu TaxID=4572 RepID=M7ZTP6_TRIUA|nr:Nudix hydrolase 26, chloroplastic [Triticum urartu]
MTVAAARCLILTPTISSSAAALRLPRIARRRPLSCSASPLAVFATMDSPPEGYRTNIFSASRIDIPTAWQMPQGGIDPGEEPRAAAVRELREETGVRSAEIVAEAPNWLTYDFPADVKDKLNARWGTNWKGQAQKWFLFRLTGGDDEINLMGDGSEKPEFSEWAWMTPQQVIEKKQVAPSRGQGTGPDQEGVAIAKWQQADPPCEMEDKEAAQAQGKLQ